MPGSERTHIRDGHKAQESILIDYPVPLPIATQFVVTAEPPLPRVGHNTGPDHVHVQVEKTTAHVVPSFNERGMETPSPEGSLPADAPVVVPGEGALQPLHHFGQIVCPGNPGEKMDVVRSNDVVQNPDRPETPRGLPKPLDVMLPVDVSTKEKSTLLTPVSDMHAAVLDLRSGKTHYWAPLNSDVEGETTINVPGQITLSTSLN